MLEKQGDTAGAQAAYQRAAGAGNADCAANALVFLGIMLRKRGDRSGARTAFQRVVDSGNATGRPPRGPSSGTCYQIRAKHQSDDLNAGSRAWAVAAWCGAVCRGHEVSRWWRAGRR